MIFDFQSSTGERMRVLHLTSFYPHSSVHLSDEGSHPVYRIVSHLEKHLGADTQHVIHYYSMLAPYYGMLSQEKKHNDGLRLKSWIPHLTRRPVPELPKGYLKQATRPLWQRATRLSFIDSIPFDVIHLHSPVNLGIVAVRIQQRTKKPLIVTPRGEFNKHAWPALTKPEKRSALAAIHAADAIATASACSAREIRNSFSRPVHAIPNGTNAVFNSFAPSKTRNHSTILFVGILCERKDILLLIKEFKSILQTMPDARLRIIGEGPLASAVNKEAKDCEQITLLGHVSSEGVRDEMRSAAILCVPSRTETFGIVYAEAMKQKMAVVGRAGTGIDGHGERGVHYELIDNDDDLKPLLLSLLKDSDRCTKLGELGRELALPWDWKHCAKKYADVYEEVCRRV